jgi:GTPase SAR1 family protein
MTKLRCKVVILGDSTVGKTAIIKMFLERNFPNQYLITMNPQVFNKVIPVSAGEGAFVPVRDQNSLSSRSYNGMDNENNTEELSQLQQQMLGHSTETTDEVELYIFDVCGSKLFENYVQDFLENMSAFIIVYDVTNEASFQNVQKWYDKCVKSRSSTNNNKRHASSLIGCLIGNKADMVQFQKVSMLQGESFAKDKGLRFFQMSAMTDNNAIDEPFRFIANQFYSLFNEKTEATSYLCGHSFH